MSIGAQNLSCTNFFKVGFPRPAVIFKAQKLFPFTQHDTVREKVLTPFKLIKQQSFKLILKTRLASVCSFVSYKLLGLVLIHLIQLYKCLQLYLVVKTAFVTFEGNEWHYILYKKKEYWSSLFYGIRLNEKTATKLKQECGFF